MGSQLIVSNQQATISAFPRTNSRRSGWMVRVTTHRRSDRSSEERFPNIGTALLRPENAGQAAVGWASGSADVSFSGQALLPASRNGFNWLFLDLLGAFGEELYTRAIVLLIAERFLGRTGPILVSGLMFSGLHISNPGASWVWLLRLFLQGSLLAYAVFRTQSLWWSVGHHTGWNWVSAPLFGAAGSGYIDEGHILNFFPKGSVWLTGGPVGPEGSVFAFLAVIAATGLLLSMTKDRSLQPAFRKIDEL